MLALRFFKFLSLCRGGAVGMSLILEVKSGPFSGRKVPVSAGPILVIGRAPERAQFAVPHDNHMSSIHFVVQCGPTGCRVIDKESTNGTFLNGKRIDQAALSNGDEIRSGQTVFLATIVVDAAAGLQTVPQTQFAPAPVYSSAPTPSPLRPSPDPVLGTFPTPKCVIGGWSFARVPVDWEVKDGIGFLQKVPGGGFQSNITAMEERLSGGITLEAFVEAQIKMLREYLKEPQIDAAIPPKIAGAENSVGVEIHYATKDGQTVHIHRIYVRHGPIVGVASLTTLESELQKAQEAFHSVLSQASFLPQY
jgi:hypothetical protein